MCKVLALLVLLSLFLYPGALQAQTTNGSITGRVTDLSKAIIADAKVAAVNSGTNFRHETATASANTRSRICRRERIASKWKSPALKKLIRPDVILYVQDARCVNSRNFPRLRNRSVSKNEL